MIRAQWPLLLVAAAVACGAAVDRREQRVRGAVGMAQDTIGPAAPPGAPASAFPSPMRPVADIVAPRWSDEDDRDDVGEFARVVQLARIGRGQRVADIGAGDGYYVTRLSPLVGATGEVFGQDIIPDYLDILHRRVQRDGLRNVRVVRGDPHDPRLPEGGVDVAIMIHMYHEIESPYALLWNLAGAMKPGGLVGVIDLDRKIENHGTPPALLRCEFEAVGYRRVSRIDMAGGTGYIAIFEAPKARPKPTDIKPCRAKP